MRKFFVRKLRRTGWGCPFSLCVSVRNKWDVMIQLYPEKLGKTPELLVCSDANKFLSPAEGQGNVTLLGRWGDRHFVLMWLSPKMTKQVSVEPWLKANLSLWSSPSLKLTSEGSQSLVRRLGMWMSWRVCRAPVWGFLSRLTSAVFLFLKGDGTHATPLCSKK